MVKKGHCVARLQFFSNSSLLHLATISPEERSLRAKVTWPSCSTCVVLNLLQCRDPKVGCGRSGCKYKSQLRLFIDGRKERKTKENLVTSKVKSSSTALTYHQKAFDQIADASKNLVLIAVELDLSLIKQF